MLAFSLVGLAYLYVLLRTQAWLPFNPAHAPNMSPDLAWNTAVSFTTNTNWQFYSGESAMSYLSQMAGLAWHNFVSAAVGIAIAIAVVRGLVRTSVKTLGNFWVDLVRASLYVLLPISIVVGLFLVWQGVPQNFNAYRAVTSLEGTTQSITGGPMASQEVIKELGTNGGGFVNANSSAPNENPNPLSNLIELLLIFSIGAGLTYTYGKMVKDTRQGWAIFAAMSVLFFAGFAGAYWAESAGNPIVHHLGVAGGNMEGKECRFGVAASALFATVTTDTSCGAVNSMHDSFMPLGGLDPAGGHAARRDRLRRRRQRALRDDRLRRADRLHRRTDGGAHPRVPREEDRAPRGAVRHFGRAGDAGPGPRTDGDRGGRRRRAPRR